jgi:hypothetical protein
MTPSGIEPATFWLVAQYLNQLRQRGVRKIRKKNTLSKDAINETYFIFVKYTTHKMCFKLPSESPCLRRTSTATSTFSRSANKTPSRRWPPIPPCDQQTGPDRTTVNPADITRQFTSLIALGLIAARSGVCITERNFGNEWA